MKWHFHKHNGFDDVDQSSSAEAFVSSNLRDLATALVRESIQNVLDAQRNGNGPARVCLTLRTVEPETASAWMGDLESHLRMDAGGLPDAPMPDEPCRTLAIEDFETCGLTGDYRQPYREGEQNNFVNFLYHDGVTGKAGKNLGSRGVGKIVMLIASRAHTMFAYTIRFQGEPAGPLLVGKNLLKFRTDDNGQRYGPKSYFLEDWPADAPRVPVTDARKTQRFSNDFALRRESEPGLSVLIPYLDSNINRDSLRRAIVAEYHFAILAGRLVVELAEGDQCEVIDADHLPTTGEPTVDALIDLSRWAIAHPEPEIQTQLPAPNEIQRLSEELVSQSVKDAIGEALDRRERVAIRLPLHVHPHKGDPQPTFITAYLEFAERQYDKPAFIREVLPVTDVRTARKVSQVRSLVLVEDRPLLSMLRAAEGANHTDWSPRTDAFKKSYKGRLGEIEFVASAIAKLIEIVRGQASEPVGGIATRYFSATLPDAAKTKAKGIRNKKGGETEKPEPPDDPIPTSFDVKQHESGFTITGKDKQPPPTRLSVRVAYDVLRGSPWAKGAYDPADFDFRKKKSHVQVAHHGVRLERPDPGNRLIIHPTSDDFEVAVHGFDPARDLIIDVRDSGRDKQRRAATASNQTALNPETQEPSDDREAHELHAAPEADA